MPKLKGLILLLPSLAVIIIEFKYLILDYLGDSESITLNAKQYWALAIPVFLSTTTAALVAMWVGYTMIVTKDPIRLTYDSAYEEAAGELLSKENDVDKEKSM